ncbi:hypothetical protein A33M_0633 [Rhodovulum sp. PH10]|nr:hypothetical protein A33M_0633 [Rhodovulum sp. PH10]
MRFSGVLPVAWHIRRQATSRQACHGIVVAPDRPTPAPPSSSRNRSWVMPRRRPTA